eukprot:30324-Rhodomonas_salina.1
MPLCGCAVLTKRMAGLAQVWSFDHFRAHLAAQVGGGAGEEDESRDMLGENARDSETSASDILESRVKPQVGPYAICLCVCSALCGTEIAYAAAD